MVEKQKPILVIDFDSTFVKVEGLDELATIALAGNPERADILRELAHITQLGMEGKIGFSESLKRRLQMFRANKEHIKELVLLLRANITASIQRNKDFFYENADNIYIISGGFKDYIWPVVQDFGLSNNHVLANTFIYDSEGNIIGCDEACLLSQDDGKVKQLATMKFNQPIYMIGDGFTDYRPKALGYAEKFFAFTENIKRQNIVEHADHVVNNFESLAEKV